ncbi:equilibrative nucleoside transporter 1-like [Tropilaelaps mercedesae]|uniref:Equilibrative nucleoside transporter 1-like n=1 Tax=Tropilaelaps mercedesae TaxID=418985 RepID=A0A1V9Y1V1_9ACAR|nr:equilibrative nucleoside transporter 1-like [Tropilaelaps mercedesae]
MNKNENLEGYRPETENLLSRTGGSGTTATPVKLAPGWESRHSNSDLVIALNKNDLSSDDSPPPDRCNLLFIFLLIHGIGTLMPWNMFITAKEYFTKVKLNVSLVEDTNSTEYRTLFEYNENFMGYVIVASQMPNLLCNLMNLFVQFGTRSLGPRIAGSILIETVLFVTTVVLAMVDSSGWPSTFFFITIATIVIMSACGGVYQNSIYGLAAKLPGKYTAAIVLGTNISGTITSAMSILSTFASPSDRTAAIYYFISALFVLLLCLDTYFALPLLRVYRHYQRKSSQQEASGGRPPYITVFKQCGFNCLNVFFCFFATLACFPAITADIIAVDQDFPVGEKYYVKIFCFLFFNMFAMIGNIFPMRCKFPRSARWTIVPVLLRFAFIPFFLMCNFRPNERLYGSFFDDYTYIGGMVVFALTHGYYSTLTMMYATQGVHPKYSGLAGMMAAFFLVLGIFLGGNSIFLINRLMAGPPKV